MKTDRLFNGETIPTAMVHEAFLAAQGSVYGTVTGTAEFLREKGENLR